MCGWGNFTRKAAQVAGNVTGADVILQCAEHASLGTCSSAVLVIGMDLSDVATDGADTTEVVAENYALDATVDASAEAGGDGVAAASNGADDVGNDAATSCSLNSFTGSTRVLLADGKTIPIDRVAVGDKVLATDPIAGVSASRPVTGLIVHSGPRTMTAVTLAGGATIVATDHHLFWDATAGSFIDADSLRVGDKLREATGRLIRVIKTRVYDAALTAYNLTISGIHTYYVVAGGQSVLVHNSCGPDYSQLPEPVEATGTSQGWAPRALSKPAAVGAPNPISPIGVLGKFKKTYAMLRLVTAIVPQGGIEGSASMENPISIVAEYSITPISDGL